MRLLLLLIGSVSIAGAFASCAQSDSGVGGGGVAASGAVSGSDAGKPDGKSGGTGGSSATGGAGGTSGFGGAAGSPVGGGGSGGVGATGATGGSGATGGGGSGGTGGCTPPVTGGLCDTFPQCGCTGTMACNVTSQAGTTQCVPAGTITAYNECSALTECVKGHACVGDACKAYCEQSTDCGTGTCIQVTYDNAGTPTPIPGMKVCTKKCKLENPAADCGPGLSCYPTTLTPPISTDCAGAGTATSAGACLSDGTACAPGYACLDNGDCRKWCRVGVSADCGGTQCQGFTNQVIVDGQEYGVCQ